MSDVFTEKKSYFHKIRELNTQYSMEICIESSKLMEKYRTSIEERKSVWLRMRSFHPANRRVSLEFMLMMAVRAIVLVMMMIWCNRFSLKKGVDLDDRRACCDATGDWKAADFLKRFPFELTYVSTRYCELNHTCAYAAWISGVTAWGWCGEFGTGKLITMS